MCTNPDGRRGPIIAFSAMIVVAAFALMLMAVLGSRSALALPAYAQQTGLPCGQCHVNPRGGGPRTAFGRAFARNGHRLPGHRSRSYRRSRGSSGYRYDGDYGMGPSMMRGYDGGMGPGMMGGYGR